MADGFRVLGWRGARSGPDPVAIAFTLDPQTLAIRELDGNVESLFGYPREKWSQPEFYLEIMHPDDLEAAREFCRVWENDRQSHELQYRMIDAAGRLRWVHELISVNEDGKGGIDVRGVIVDVTLRMPADPGPGSTTRLRGELRRIVTEELAQSVRMVADYAEMLGRHLSARHDDVGSDYAIGMREGIDRLEAVLARTMRAIQQDGTTPDELADRLAAVRSPRDRD